MNVSSLTFTKETKEKMEKPISHFKKGQLRWEKLKELDETGKLSSAKSRTDITSMLGLGTGYGAPYSWVSHLISDGYISETLTGFSSNQKPEYEYHIVKQRTYEAKAKAKAKTVLPQLQPKPTIEQPLVGKVFEIPTNNEAKVVIKYKELAIEIYNVSEDVIKGIVEALSNKA